ncbi:MAG: ComEC/Rec2 family competence protein [Fimbriimonadaceae bacterium]|nr:ComEC/Rec2 family competence protein [Fimbriimonadaceae bacterium]
MAKPLEPLFRELEELRLELEGRPAFLVFLAFLSGCGLIPSGGWSLLAIVPLFFAFRKQILFWMAGLILGTVLSPPPVARIQEKSSYSGLVTVSSVPSLVRDSLSAVVATPSGEKLRTTFPAAMVVSRGDVFQVKGEKIALSPGAFAVEEAAGRLRLTGGVKLIREGPAFWRWATLTRQSFVDFVRRSDPQDRQMLAAALCFNVTSGLEPHFYEDLRRTGTVHIVSTSGLHVMVAAGFLTLLLLPLPIKPEFKIGILAGLLALYAAAAGFRPPIVRAALMSLLFVGAYLFRRQSDGLTTLSVASLIYLILFPRTIQDLGFWLSIFAVGSLVLFVPSARALSNMTWREKFWQTVKTSLVVSLATAPLTAWSFGEASLIGFVINLVVVPLVDLAIVVSLGAWMISWVLPNLGSFVYQGLALPLLWLIEFVINGGSRFPLASVSVSYFSLFWLIPFVVGAFLLWRPRDRSL